MLTLIPDEQLSEAVFNAVEDGAYPAEEAIVSAELPSSAFDNLLGLLDHARAEVKVKASGMIPICSAMTANASVLRQVYESSVN